MKSFAMGTLVEDRRMKLMVPPDVVTESIAVFGIKGSGKSSTARVMVEELVKLRLPTTIIDPTGNWWGIVSNLAGNGPGLPFTILGGERGHVSLEHTAGALVADFVVDNPGFYILDLSDMRKGQQRQFYCDFAAHLYHRKNRERSAMMLVVDEADLFAPQNTFSEKGAYPASLAVGASEDIVRRGRQRGIGSMWPTQRPASLHTGVRSQCSTMICLRISGTHDIKAINEWVDANGMPDELRQEMLSALPSLPTGTGFVCSPHFLGTYAAVGFRRMETFDSFITPKAGTRPVEPKVRAEVDLAALTASMKEAIERAQAADPKTLQRKLSTALAEIERLKSRPAEVQTEVQIETRFVSVPLPPMIEALASELAAKGDELATMSKTLVSRGVELGRILTQYDRDCVAAQEQEIVTGIRPSAPIKRGHATLAAQAVGARVEERPRMRTQPLDGDAKFGKGEQAVLEALASYHPEKLTKNRIAFISGYSPKASTIDVCLSNLRKLGYIDPGTPAGLTAAGLAMAGGPRPQLRGQPLLDQWLTHSRMGEGERKVLLVLIDQYPHDMSKVDLCDATGYSSTASTMDVILSKLRKLGLVKKGQRVVTDDFMEAIRG